jgi:hypothetical protein
VVVPHVGFGWRVALVLVAPLIALQVNILRVAAIGAGIEWGELGYTNTVKEWTGWVAPVLGTAQVIALAWSRGGVSASAQLRVIGYSF